MQLTNIRGFRNLYEYICWKIEEFRKEEKTFSTLYKYMFSEASNTMVEISDGYRIKKITYGEFSDSIYKIAPSVEEALSDVPKGKYVGLYMSNSEMWIKMFWSILMCGYNPVLMNLRLNDDVLDNLISEYSIGAVISDSKKFACKTLIADEFEQKDYDIIDSTWGSEVVFMSSRKA